MRQELKRRKKLARIGMIGAGSWGTALAAHLARCGHKVEVWSIMKDETDMINNTHQQSVKLPGVVLDDSVTASTDLEEVMRDKDMLVLAVTDSSSMTPGSLTDC